MSVTGAGSQATVDLAGLQRLLGEPEIAWLVERIRGRLSREVLRLVLQFGPCGRQVSKSRPLHRLAGDR